MIKNVHWSSCQGNVTLVDFNETWIFSTDLKKILKYQTSRKPVQWDLRCYLWMDRHDKANSHVLQFCEHA